MVVFLPFHLRHPSDSEGCAMLRSQVSKADAFPVHQGAGYMKHFWVLLGTSHGQGGGMGMAVGSWGTSRMGPKLSQSMTAPRRAQTGGETKVWGMLSPKVFSGFAGTKGCLPFKYQKSISHFLMCQNSLTFFKINCIQEPPSVCETTLPCPVSALLQKMHRGDTGPLNRNES